MGVVVCPRNICSKLAGEGGPEKQVFNLLWPNDKLVCMQSTIPLHSRNDY
jgi:hypothetical protein